MGVVLLQRGVACCVRDEGEEKSSARDRSAVGGGCTVGRVCWIDQGESSILDQPVVK